MAENENEGKGAEAPADEAKAKKKSPMMLIVIIIVVGLIIGGGGAVTIMLLKGGEDTEEAEEAKKETKKEIKPTMLGPVIPLESFIVNLTGAGGRNYLKVNISIELSDVKLQEEITNKLPKIRDTILLVLSTKTFDDIKTSQGKLVMKDELLMRLNSYLTSGTIENLYFTSFVVQ